MSDKIIETAKSKKAEAGKKLAEARQQLASVEARVAMIQKEFDQWDMFVSLHEKLSGEKPSKATNSNGSASAVSDRTETVKLKKGTIPAVMAEILNGTESHSMKVNDLADELEKRGTVTSKHVVNITYTALKRRGDVFEKVSPGHFRLKNIHFEIDG